MVPFGRTASFVDKMVLFEMNGSFPSSSAGFGGTADEGEICGGFAAVRCRSGLTCVYSMGTAGICRRRSWPWTSSSAGFGGTADEGEICGGFAAVRCRSGL
ncbi:hypothetical protein MAR_037223, partial [Mya arenaria]